MKIEVNNMEIEIFEGAKVKDALRNYYIRQGKAIPKILPKVKDKYGNFVGKDGALLPNTSLYIYHESKQNYLQKLLNYLKL